jgi:hypothetical protein
MKNEKKAKFAYIQTGTDAVFGLGSTRNAAILDAGRNLEPSEIENDDGSTSYVSGKKNALLHLDRARGFSGDMKIIDRNDPEWSDYVK